MKIMYDLIILGAGPAGLSASIYASRYKINHVVIGNIFDGSVSKAHLIENWPGEKSIKGSDLIMKFYNHVKSLNTDVIQENIIGIEKERWSKAPMSKGLKGGFIITTDSNNVYKAKSILIALGTKHRKLNIPGEKRLLGKGVSYCAVCDGAFFKNKTVAVAGGSNSAAMAATMLSEHAKKVFMIYRGKPLRCEPIMAERLEKNPKVEIIYNTNAIKVLGNKKVEAVEIDKKYKGSHKIKLDGLFIAIGLVPSASMAESLGLEIDKDGYIVVDQGGLSSINGVAAAGDITNNSNKLHQIVTAVSEGAIATTSVYKYLKQR
jgi:thioredoxin reductase (NADPH)